MPKNFLSDTAVAQILGEHGISGDDFETVLIYANVEGAWGADGRLFWTLKYGGDFLLHGGHSLGLWLFHSTAARL
jgi:3-mercaptopyruvate sulfurtransferase SseA